MICQLSDSLFDWCSLRIFIEINRPRLVCLFDAFAPNHTCLLTFIYAIRLFTSVQCVVVFRDQPAWLFRIGWCGFDVYSHFHLRIVRSAVAAFLWNILNIAYRLLTGLCRMQGFVQIITPPNRLSFISSFLLDKQCNGVGDNEEKNYKPMVLTARWCFSFIISRSSVDAYV